ncbi:MAG: GNAT family N-acetyltransferase [Nannocystis sp.]|nr:GNAT family protein [Nannocystis sp.]MBA3549297.1 GNAT family N-acetyltransferase [Nannocystis sp.]
MLRPLREADAAAIRGYRDDPEVARYQSWDRYSEADALAMITSLAGTSPGTPGAWFQWGIVHRSSGALIGDCGLKTRDDPRLGELGYTLARGHQGQGLATEALRAVLELAFRRLAMHRLSASVDVDNLRSLALLERLGWRREAHHRRSVWFKGAWCDDVIYAQLQGEWLARPQP